VANYFLTIAGNIGVGKSTLVRLLAERLDWTPVFEAVTENPYLPDFYREMERWSFHSQVFFLSRRLQQHHALLQLRKSVIQDRSVYEDAEVFARNLYQQGHLSERDWGAYYELYQTLTTLLRPPHLVVYLQASVPSLRRRIAQRGRGYEQAIEESYLARLNELYDQWAATFKLSPVLTVNTDNLNYVQYESHLDQIWHKIEHRLQGAGGAGALGDAESATRRAFSTIRWWRRAASAWKGPPTTTPTVPDERSGDTPGSRRNWLFWDRVTRSAGASTVVAPCEEVNMAFASKPELARALVDAFEPLPGTQTYVLTDSWYPSRQLLETCQKRGFHLISAVKSDRKFRVANHNLQASVGPGFA
jgi:deoxyadenosine/deoxycytidine kinase